jgi:RHS repeat-associated protein
MVCVSSTAAGAQPGGSCNVLEVEYDASGQRVRERAGATTRYFLGNDLSHVPAEASPGGIAETRIEIEAFGERVGVRLLEGGRIFNAESGPWGVGRPLPLPFPPALLVWALAVLAITAYVIACLLGARIGGDPLGAPVGGTVALIAMVALILPPSAWAGVTGPPEGTVIYRAVLSDPLGSGSVLLDGSGDRIRHTVFRPFGAVYEEVGPGFGTSRLDRRYFAGHASQEETGLVYMQARWLDPEVGRFLSVDPLIRSLAKPQSLNGYSYVENNPTLFVDPTGMAAGPSGADPFAGVPEFPAAPPGPPIEYPSGQPRC